MENGIGIGILLFLLLLFLCLFLWEAFLFLICLDAATKSVSLRPGWDAILSHEPNRIEYRTTHSLAEADLHFNRTKIQKGKTRISVNYIIKLIHLAGISFTFQPIFLKLFVNGEQTLFLSNFKKKLEVNGELYIIVNPILEINGLRKLRHLTKKAPPSRTQDGQQSNVFGLDFANITQHNSKSKNSYLSLIQWFSYAGVIYAGVIRLAN